MSSLDVHLVSGYLALVDCAEQLELVQLANGTASIRSNRVGETFHPVIGPAAEAKALYVDQLNMVDQMRSTKGEFVVWDIGLGGGANALTIFRETRECTCPLKMISFDRTLAPLSFALKHADTLGYFGGYSSPVEKILQYGESEFEDGNRRVHWTMHLADFPTSLRTGSFKSLPAPHVILFDAYSPARNPEMWTAEVFASLFEHLSPNRPCQLPTYSRSTLLRVTLLLAGFFVGVGHATGEKEETTIASNSLVTLAEPLAERWMERVKKSPSAEPLHSAEYRQAPLSADSLEKLLKHPQFSG